MMLTTTFIQNRPGSKRGFTLTELLIVMVLLSILSATAIPALNRLDDAQRSGLLNECERLVMLSRSRAISTGVPTGLTFDLTEQSIAMISLKTDSSGVEPVTRFGTGTDYIARANAFPGASIELAGPENTPVALGITTIWFDYDGTPQQREADGELPVPLQNDYLIRITDGPQLTIAPYTGMVSR